MKALSKHFREPFYSPQRVLSTHFRELFLNTLIHLHTELKAIFLYSKTPYSTLHLQKPSLFLSSALPMHCRPPSIYTLELPPPHSVDQLLDCYILQKVLSTHSEDPYNIPRAASLHMSESHYFTLQRALFHASEDPPFTTQSFLPTHFIYL